MSRVKCACGERAVGIVITPAGSKPVCQEHYQAECTRYAEAISA